jgi:uncharacterized protein (DUF488 family)
LKLFTIGFTKTTAESFFTRLIEAGVTRVIDVRISNSSQLAGFAKQADLEYFLRAIAEIDYEHHLELAPTEELFKMYRGGGSWEDLEAGYTALLAERRVEEQLDRERFDGVCLLCSEHEPSQCHRRLAAEYLASRWGGVEIEHL